MTRSRRQSTFQKNRRLKTFFSIAALFASLGLVFFVFVYLLLYINQPSSVLVTSFDVGRLQQASFLDRFIYKETTMETEKGTFLVHGAFVAIKGHSLVLEMRKDGSRMLCDLAEKTCAQLVR